MRKNYLLTVFLCIALAVGSIGCGGAPVTKEIVKNDAADTSADETDAFTDTDDTDAAASTETDTSDASANQVTIEEQVLVDQDGIKITATEYVSDGLFGDGLKLLIENNTTTNYRITCDALIVNDFMISDWFSTEVAAGKKSYETVDLYSSELKAAGIDTVAKIEIYFRAYDSDTWDDLFDDVYAEVATSEYANMDSTVDDAGAELYNAGGIRIIGKTVDENSFWGKAILLYAENNSGQNITISADSLSINGFMIEPYYVETIYDGKKAIGDVTLFSSELEENGITSIDEVELQFHIYNPDTYQTIADSEPITFSAQ